MFFFIMGAPMLMVEAEALQRGLRGIDVRHEQAAAMMAHAYARLRLRPGVCMAASGPGVTNLITGVAHAWADGVPIIALGGSAPVGTWGRGAFQEIDQLAMMAPCTKWAARVHQPKRLPELPARGVLPRDVGQARPGLPRSAGRCPVPGGRRRRGRVAGALASRAAQPAAGERRPRSTPCWRCCRRRAPDRDRRQRRAVVGGRERAAGVRRTDRHPVLHHARRAAA